MYSTISEIKAANKAAGYFYFSPEAMHVWQSRCERGVYGGRYFVMSEVSDNGTPRRYFYVRQITESGRIEFVDGPFFDAKGAREAARKFAKG